jgi:hypothetical protein
MAIETIVSHLKDRVPAPLASQLDSFLSGNADGTSGIGGALGGSLGGNS